MSALSKLCPQVAGLTIDDFLLNFRDEGGKHGAENISGCVTCPDTHPFSYGDDDNGAHTTLFVRLSDQSRRWTTGYFCCPCPAKKGD